jgi:ketosteroid isomerase-like protein
VSRSGEAKEIVSRLYDLLNAGDLDGVAALIADDGELAVKILPGAKNDPDWTYKGPAGFVDYAQKARERFDGYKIKTNFGQFVGSDDAAMAGVRITGKERATGRKLKAKFAHAWKLRDGQVALCQVYDDTNDAFRAAGFGTPTKEPRPGSYGKVEQFGRFESNFDFDIELELPVGEVQVFLLNYPVPEDLTVELTGPNGQVEMTPNPNAGSGGTDPTTGGSGGIPLARVAYTEVKVPGPHRMRVTGFHSENQRFLMVGREDWFSKKITQR